MPSLPARDHFRATAQGWYIVLPRASHHKQNSITMRVQRIGLWFVFGVVVSGCGGGGGSNTPPAPAISYGPSGSATTQFTFVAQTPVSLTPTNNGGAATSWSVTPALPGGPARRKSVISARTLEGQSSSAVLARGSPNF